MQSSSLFDEDSGLRNLARRPRDRATALGVARRSAGLWAAVAALVDFGAECAPPGD